jgi:predicted PurR-regulated permease PerM
MSRERLKAVVLFALTAAAVILCGLLAWPFLPALTWALALGVIAYPLHYWLVRRTGWENLSAGLTVAVVAAALIVPGYFLTRQLALETTAFARQAQEKVESGELEQSLQRVPWLGGSLDWLREHVDLQREVRNLSERIVGSLQPLLSGSIAAALQFLTMLLVLFFVFRDRRTILGGMRALLPMSRAESDRLFKRVADAVHATIYSEFVVSLVQGVSGGLLFWALGLPAPVFWGLIMTVLGILPYLGAFLVWVPAAAVLALAGRYWEAAVLVAWGLLMAGPVNNVLYAWLAGRRLRLHPLPTFFAFVGGLAVFGLSGMVIGPVILAVTLALLEVWRQRTKDGHVADAPEPAPPADASDPEHRPESHLLTAGGRTPAS